MTKWIYSWLLGCWCLIWDSRTALFYFECSVQQFPVLGFFNWEIKPGKAPGPGSRPRALSSCSELWHLYLISSLYLLYIEKNEKKDRSKLSVLDLYAFLKYSYVVSKRSHQATLFFLSLSYNKYFYGIMINKRSLSLHPIELQFACLTVHSTSWSD